MTEGKLSSRIYSLLLLAYPCEFRREFGPEMLQVFLDYYRAEDKHLGTRLLLWWRTLIDLFVSAAREHSDNSGKENFFMSNLRRDLVAVSGCVGIIVVAALLLSYGRKHEVASILTFGYALDALVTTGVIGNFIIFLLLKTTRFNPLRIAFWTLLVVHAVPAIFIAVIGRNDPLFNPGSVAIGYVVSFLFWLLLHWAWRSTSSREVAQ
jgi:hypothetical protein